MVLENCWADLGASVNRSATSAKITDLSISRPGTKIGINSSSGDLIWGC